MVPSRFGDKWIKQGKIVTGPCGSVSQWSCSHGTREVLGSSPSRAMCFFLPCDIWWVCAQAASSKGTISSVPAWFQAELGTDLIKQGEIVTGRPCGSVAVVRVLAYVRGHGFESGRAMCFFLPCDINMALKNEVECEQEVQAIVWCDLCCLS